MASGGSYNPSEHKGTRPPARPQRAHCERQCFVVAALMALAVVGCSADRPAAQRDPDNGDARASASAQGDNPARPPTDSAIPDDLGRPILPVTVVDESGAEVTVESIERIIPLDGDVAEVVFALGLGANVVATDLSATYPPEADALPEIGYQRALSAETVASFAPTVLLATDIAGPPEALEDLRRLGYPLVILPNESTPTGAGRKIRAVAAALGVPGRGMQIADALDTAIAQATVPANAGSADASPADASPADAGSADAGSADASPADASPADTSPADASPDTTSRLKVLALYVRGTTAHLVLGESANTRWLIKAAGGVDVSEAMGVRDNAPISAEAILAAAPDVLLVPQAGLESVGGVDGLLEIGALAQTPAGRHRQVLAYDDQLLLGNGPRTAQMLTHLRDDLNAAADATQRTTDREAS